MQKQEVTPNLKVLLTHEQIQRRVQELGRRITRDYRNKNLVLIGVLKGAFVFLSDLARAIDLPLDIDFLGLSSYGDSTKTSGVVKITHDLTQPIEHKDVLVVEDIVDTGLTLSYLMENFKTRHPKSIKLCTLLYKPANTIKKVPLKYVGFEIENKFVIGYGLDLAEKYRNLPYIGYLDDDTNKKKGGET